MPPAYTIFHHKRIEEKSNYKKKSCRMNLTIHLRPGAVEKPVCLLTNDVCLVNLNLEGSTEPPKTKCEPIIKFLNKFKLKC